MEPFAVKNNLKYYSRRPPVSYVIGWTPIYDKLAIDNWRGLPDSAVRIEEAQNIAHYYKLSYTVNDIKKVKYYYGESAWTQLRRFVSDLGHNIEGGQ